VTTSQGQAQYDADVVVISDFRLPGGTTSSIAEEVQAQSDAGLRTTLIHVASSVTNYALPWSRHIRRIVGLPRVNLRTPGSRVHAKLIIVRHPTVILSTRHRLQNVTGEHVLIIANHAAIDAGGKQHYDIAAADAKLREIFGTEPIWAPIGPVVRGTMLQQTREVPFREQDWVNIFALPDEVQPRTGFLQQTPVIGRHSRPQPGKWPNTGRDILAAYPDSTDYTVRVLGGAEVAEHLLGYVPANWEVVPFGGEDPARFLRRIDFWVYMHHPDLKEAFGRAAMEALAAGCVAIMPPYMEELFGDAALYARPHEVTGLVDEYFADQQKFLRQSLKAQEFAKGFSPRMHIDRLRELGVEPHEDGAEPRLSPGLTDADQLASAEEPTVGFPLTEPVGRPISVVIIDGEPEPDRKADHMSAVAMDPQRILVTVDDRPWEGLPGTQAVFIPSVARLNMEQEGWEELFAARVQRLLEGFAPHRVYYDGVLPPPALTDVLQGVAAEKTWLRRYPQASALQEGGSATGLQQVRAERHFHTVVQAEETGVTPLLTAAEKDTA
jgi:hypothetical protein